MELDELLEKVEKRIDENAIKIENNFRQIQENSGALGILRDYKAESKRWFAILIVVLCMWFATIVGFLYYINNVDYMETEEIADTSDGGNACVGDNCSNGDINYGKSN